MASACRACSGGATCMNGSSARLPIFSDCRESRAGAAILGVAGLVGPGRGALQPAVAAGGHGRSPPLADGVWNPARTDRACRRRRDRACGAWRSDRGDELGSSAQAGGGVPAGTARLTDILWLDSRLFVSPLSKPSSPSGSRRRSAEPERGYSRGAGLCVRAVARRHSGLSRGELHARPRAGRRSDRR
jgi:hypothetical protein